MSADADRPPPTGSDVAGVHPLLRSAAATSWRLLVVGALVVAVVLLLGRLLVVVVPVAVAALLTRALWPLFAALRRRGARPALAAAAALAVLLLGAAGVLGLVGVAFAGEVDELGPTISQGLDDVTTWLVEDSPWDIERDDVERWREQAEDAIGDFFRSGGSTVLTGAVVAGEVLIGLVLALVVTFFLLKDGESFRDTASRWVADARRDPARRAAGRGWDAAGGYLKGAALLGLVEGVVMGLTLWLVGGRLIAPVMVVTFVLAFVPIVGAVTAGVIAVLVALVTAGAVPALIVGVVALVVQQFDNDLLAPVIYGKSVQLHPLVILLGIAAGGALFGFVGTFLAVPALAVGINAARGYRGEELSPATVTPPP